MHVKFVENPNTIDAGGPLRDICSLFLRASVTIFILAEKNQYVFSHDAHLVDSSDLEKSMSIWLSIFCLVCLDQGVYLCHGTFKVLRHI